MIDHLLRFDTEAAAQADPVVGAYFVQGAWRGDICIPNVSVYAVTGTQTITDPDTGTSYQADVRTPFSGWYIVISLSEISAALRDLPGNLCRMITDRDAANRGDAFVRYVAPDVTQADLATAIVEPTFAGSRYPFGSPN
jgi:hypothetical protein